MHKPNLKVSEVQGTYLLEERLLSDYSVILFKITLKSMCPIKASFSKLLVFALS